MYAPKTRGYDVFLKYSQYQNNTIHKVGAQLILEETKALKRPKSGLLNRLLSKAVGWGEVM